MEMLLLRQQAFQQYQQWLVQAQHESGAESSSSSTSSPYLSPQWLVLYNQMLQLQQTLQAANHQPMVNIHSQVASGQISAGPSSPAVPASSVSGSDGEGGGMDEDDDMNAFPTGKKRSPRALTGKHVRLGTGASPIILNTLKLQILERERMKNSKKNLPGPSNSKLKGSKLKARAK